jgi:hypothetical protein
MITEAQKNTWIEALESGKYNHGKYRLANVDDTTGVLQHCCLGVLVDTLGYKLKGMEVDCGDGAYRELPPSKKEFNRFIDDKGREQTYEFFEDFFGKKYVELYSLNDRVDTCDYTKQVDWIRRNL